MQERRAIHTIHTSATNASGESYTIVTLDNDEIGIARDGEYLPGLAWPSHQLDQCAAAFVRLTRLYAQSRAIKDAQALAPEQKPDVPHAITDIDAAPSETLV